MEEPAMVGEVGGGIRMSQNNLHKKKCTSKTIPLKFCHVGLVQGFRLMVPILSSVGTGKIIAGIPQIFLPLVLLHLTASILLRKQDSE